MIMAGRKIEGLPAPPPSTDGFETPSLRPMLLLLLLLEERWHRSPGMGTSHNLTYSCAFSTVNLAITQIKTSFVKVRP